MADRSRLVRYYVVAVVAALVGLTAAYDAGMSVFEGRPRTALESLESVLQSSRRPSTGRTPRGRRPR
jgi:hypothetical protein